MAPRIKYNLDTFRKLVISGTIKKKITAEMSIKNSATFNSLLLRLMETDKKYYAIKDSSKKAVAKKTMKTTIGKNKTLTLSSKMLENSGLKHGDCFNIKIVKNKIILTLIEDSY